MEKKRNKPFKNGDLLKVFAYKHNGKFHRMWDEIIILENNNDYIVAMLPYGTKVTERTKCWYTLEPAVIYFDKTHWFNIIARIVPQGVEYYCNLASPPVYESKALKYIDYDLDIKVKKNLNFKVVDQHEFIRHKKQMKYPIQIEQIIEKHLKILESWIINKVGPFKSGFPYYWYGLYGEKYM